MTSKGLDEKKLIVTAREISLILGVSTSRVRQLYSEEALIREGHGKYNLPESIQAYIEYVKERDRTDEEIDKTMEEALWTRARRKKSELELKIMKGEVHRSEDVESVMNEMLASFRARMLVIPGKAAPHLLAEEDTEVIKNIIKNHIYEALQELSDYDPDVFYARSTDKLSIEEETGGDNSDDKEAHLKDGKPNRKE